jgi:hypothetical protein
MYLTHSDKEFLRKLGIALFIITILLLSLSSSYLLIDFGKHFWLSLEDLNTELIWQIKISIGPSGNQLEIMM